MPQRRRYKNPPIEEALCEFRFAPGQDWDFTIPGKLHTELGDDYPGSPQQQKVIEVELRGEGDEPVRYGEKLSMVQLVTKDGKRIVGVGPDVLSVHMLRPYQYVSEQGGWDEFRPRIEKALEAYWKVAQPEGVKRIGMRYINKIVVPEDRVRIGNYIKYALPVVDGLPDHQNNAMSRVDYSYEDGVRLILSHWSSNEASNQVELLLDFDLIWENTESVAREEAMLKVDDLHTREGDAFETVITNEARRLFNDD